MLLQRLSEYADRIGLPPTLYNETPIASIIDLDGGSGRATLISTLNPANPREKRGIRRLAPQIARAVGIQPLLLADNAEYTFGLPRPVKPEDTNAEKEAKRLARVADCHDQYMDILTRCATATREPAVEAVRAFLASPGATESLDLPDDFDRGGLITFRVDGVFPTELPAVQAFWATEHDPASSATQPVKTMQCLVCGQRRPVLERLQGKIKGVPNGQQAGTSIISANADAFESYGLAASLIAPTCASCGEKFTKALNALIANEQHRFFLGGSVFVFWTREKTTFSLLNTLNTPDAATVKRLLDSLRRGEETRGVDPNAFYAVSLSASGGRAVVRDWIDTTVGAVQEHVGRWFDRQRIVGNAGEVSEPIGIFRLAAATVRDGKDLTPQTARALLHAAVTGTPLPWNLLAQAVRRNQAEQRVTRTRAALIKLVLASQTNQEYIKGGTMVELEPDYTHPTSDQSSAAYHCGRLLAILENAQDAAIPGIKAGIVDRFYGTASSAPVAVFGRLMRGVQPHLAKLDRDNHGAYVNIQRELTEVLSRLSVARDPRTNEMAGFPRTLTLEQQGLFSLGYYHQRAKRFTRTVRAAEQVHGESDDA